MSGKRNVLTLIKRPKVIEMRDKGYSLARVTAEGKSTVFDIMKQKDRLRVYIAEHEIEDGSFRKKMRVADDKELD